MSGTQNNQAPSSSFPSVPQSLPPQSSSQSNIQGQATSEKPINTRTKRIADYNPSDHYQLLHDPWGGDKHPNFEYNNYGELKEPSYSAADIQDFIVNHPRNGPHHLILWVQKTPADSSKRYPSVTSSRCRLENCPAKGQGSRITPGWLRVALDNRWTTYHRDQNPYHVAGFVHLFCLEKFLNFPYICSVADVQPDEREIFASEPNEKFAGSLGAGSRLSEEVSRFTDAVKNNRFFATFPNYPANDLNKTYHGTLSHELGKIKVAGLTKSKKAMYELRGIKGSNEMQHLGDLEMVIAAKKRELEDKRSGKYQAGPSRSTGNRRTDQSPRVEEEEEDVDLVDEDEEDAEPSSDSDDTYRHPRRRQRVGPAGTSQDEDTGPRRSKRLKHKQGTPELSRDLGFLEHANETARTEQPQTSIQTPVAHGGWPAPTTYLSQPRSGLGQMYPQDMGAASQLEESGNTGFVLPTASAYTTQVPDFTFTAPTPAMEDPSQPQDWTQIPTNYTFCSQTYDTSSYLSVAQTPDAANTFFQPFIPSADPGLPVASSFDNTGIAGGMATGTDYGYYTSQQEPFSFNNFPLRIDTTTEVQTGQNFPMPHDQTPNVQFQHPESSITENTPMLDDHWDIPGQDWTLTDADFYPGAVDEPQTWTSNPVPVQTAFEREEADFNLYMQSTALRSVTPEPNPNQNEFS